LSKAQSTSLEITFALTGGGSGHATFRSPRGRNQTSARCTPNRRRWGLEP